MASIPQKMQAYAQDPEGKKASVKEVPVPELEDNEVLIKIHYAAQNPTDWKHVAAFAPPFAICGCDYSGEVVKLGNNLKVTLQVGDKVAGWVHGGLFTNKGSYAQYAKQESDLLFKVPEGLSMEEASSFGVPWVTVCQAMIQDQKKEFPPAKSGEGQWFLVYGASSSVGLFAVNLAKVMGYKVVAVCSSRNFELVKSYGADELVDYKDKEHAISEIKRITGGGVSLGMDTISEGSSFDISLAVFGDKGGKLNLVLPASKEVKATRPDVEAEWTLAYTLLGKPFKSFIESDVVPEDRAFGVDIYKRTPELITKYGIKPNPIEVRGGLEAITEGFELQKAGKVSGKKFAYKIGA